MLVSLTVGKVDAGVAVLLTEDKRLIEFPSILLPAGISSGSIVDITVARNLKSEAEADASFSRLQNDIHQTFGIATPAAPVLRCRNATQTSVVLEWDPISLATASLRSLSLYRNGAKAGAITRPLEWQSTKISGLAIDTEYTFQLVLRTSAGTHSSERLVVRTHKLTDLTGITVTPGIMPALLRQSLQTSVERIGCKLADTVRIDTTHFICTEGRGPAWEKAMESNIPVVVPDWIKGCEREGRIVGVRGYYLNADARFREVGPGVIEKQQQQQHQQQQQSSQQKPQLSPQLHDEPRHRPLSLQSDSEASSTHVANGITSPVSPFTTTTGPPIPPPKNPPKSQPSPSLEPKSIAVVEHDEPKVRTEDLKSAMAHSAVDSTQHWQDEVEGDSDKAGIAQVGDARIQHAPREPDSESESKDSEDGEERFEEVSL